ncbi:MAG: hypothetical protein P1V97_15100, partial [Planctomycetota bacterium]|nr:hypothetical protein [Planctomycetota bacterium]
MKKERRAIIVVIGILGAGFAYGVAEAWHIRLNVRAFAFKEAYPAPHTLPLIEGRTSLRLAMVHDVLHERYLVHSEAYWKARSEIAKDKLDSAKALEETVEIAPDDELLNAFDVYGVCLDKLQRSDEAVQVLRKKLAIQRQLFPEFNVDEEAVENLTYDSLKRNPAYEPKLSKVREGFYRTHVNLGTFLIHASLGGAFSGDKSARAGLEEGYDHIKKSMTINPGAHFGRET